MKRRRIAGRGQAVIPLVLAILGLAACQSPAIAPEGSVTPADLPVPSAARGELGSATQSPLADAATPDEPAADVQATGLDAQQTGTLTVQDLGRQPSLPEDSVPVATAQWFDAGSDLPIFVEMVQAPMSPELSPKMPPANARPSGVYLFGQGDRWLLLTPEIQVLPTTQVLVGLSSASVPGQPNVASDLFQFPSAQPAPLQVVALDAHSGTATLLYADQIFELGAGESRSFKQAEDGEPALLSLTTITNHGRLAGIGSLSSDPDTP